MSNQHLLTLQNLFPTMEQSLVQSVLAQSGDSLDIAIDNLLLLGTQQTMQSRLSSSPTSEIALRIQQNLDKLKAEAEREATPPPPTVDPYEEAVRLIRQREAQEKEDELIALELSRLEGDLRPQTEVESESQSELLARTILIGELQSELEHTVLVSEPGRIELAMNEIRKRFFELQAYRGDFSVDKMMVQLKQALAIIDITVRNITKKATSLGKKVKDEVDSWRLLERLETFATTLSQELRNTISRLRPSVPTEQEQKEKLEEYLVKLGERKTTIDEAKGN